ncbi:MAG: hypothetical protein QM689_12585 [Oscillospiraceae bacterium]
MMITALAYAALFCGAGITAGVYAIDRAEKRARRKHRKERLKWHGQD